MDGSVQDAAHHAVHQRVRHVVQREPGLRVQVRRRSLHGTGGATVPPPHKQLISVLIAVQILTYVTQICIILHSTVYNSGVDKNV